MFHGSSFGGPATSQDRAFDILFAVDAVAAVAGIIQGTTVMTPVVAGCAVVRCPGPCAVTAGIGIGIALHGIVVVVAAVSCSLSALYQLLVSVWSLSVVQRVAAVLAALTVLVVVVHSLLLL